MTTMVRSDEILEALSRRHRQDVWLTQVKTGPTQVARPGELHIIDGLAIARSWAHPCITGYEVKVARGDYLRDSKWAAYLEVTHKFAFACPRGLIQPDELPPEVGLVWYYPDSRATVLKRAPVYRPRPVDQLPGIMLYYILISRMDSDVHPWFGERRHYCEAYVRDKADRRQLGDMLGTHLAEDVGRLAKRIDELERELETSREAAALLERVREICRAYHVYGAEWRGDWFVDGLERRLRDGIGADIYHDLQRITVQLDELAERLRPAAAGE